MCGIGGCVMWSGLQPDRERLKALSAALGHRGPDDEGIEVVGSVGLVHRRLTIVDLSPAGHAPMRHGEHWLTYNGEVFNHLELRERLAGPWAGTSDTETVLRAWAAHGPAALEQFNGFFGLGAYDAASRVLHLARDRFGVKPLYVAQLPEGLWFASEMSALLAAGVPREPDREVLAHLARWGWAHGDATALRHVRKLAPGSLMTVDVDRRSVSERRWFTPADTVDHERIVTLAGRLRAPGGREALRDELEDVLREAVRRRLMADVPVATMCSGGIDSSLVASFATEFEPGMVAYNASIADQPENDESRFARMMADRVGAELRTVPVTAASWRRDFVATVAHIEYPLLHPSSVAMLQIARDAHRHGIKVLLSGEGADELFGGYEFLHRPQRRDFAARGNRPASLARAALRLKGRRLGGRGALDSIGLGPSASSNARLQDAEGRAQSAYRDVPGYPRGARRRLMSACLADLELYLPHLLNRQDKATMAASVEVREPFLDPDVVALAVNLPLEARVEPAAKGLLREVALGRLPRASIERPKMGFGFDTGRYLRPAVRPGALTDGALREALGVPRDRWIAGYANPHGHDPLYAWSAEAWCRLALEGQSVATVEEAVWADVDAPVEPRANPI